MKDRVILLVEDDPDDVFFLQEAFKKAGLAGALRVARDGEEAVAYLLGKDPRPSLVLLDLKLPRRSGLEVLEWRRGEPGMTAIPVVVLTSSVSETDVRRAYELGANAYLVKPIESAAQAEMVEALRRFWLGLNRLPDLETAL